MFEEEDFQNAPLIDLDTWVDESPLPLVEEPSSLIEEPVEQLVDHPVQETITEPKVVAEEPPKEPVQFSEEDFNNAPLIDLTNFSDEEPEQGSLTEADLMQMPDDMKSIRAYMVERKGVNWRDRPDEEVLDAYIGHMRYVNANTFSTAGEYRYIMNGDDNRKATAAAAYASYNKLGGMFSRGRGEAIDAATDYAGAIFSDPVNYLSGFVGKAVVGLGTSAARKAAVQTAARSAFRVAEKKAAGTGMRAASEVIKGAGRKKAYATIAASTFADAGAMSAQDILFQTTLMEQGSQDDYSVFQTAIAATAGVVGGGIAAVPVIGKAANVSGLSNSKVTIIENRAARSKGAARKMVPRLQKSVAKLNKTAQNWADLVKEGRTLNPSLEELSDINKWFFDLDDEDSIVRIIADSGAVVNTSSDVVFTEELIGFAKNIPPEQLEEINKTLSSTGLRFGELLNIVAAGQERGSTGMNMAMQAKQMMKNANSVSVARKKADSAIMSLSGEAVEEVPDAVDPKVIKYATSVWRRALISHPATTMANVKGWGLAAGSRSLAEILHGGVLGTYGLAGKLAFGTFGDKSLSRSKALMRNQIFKAQTLIDPYSTREAFESLVERAPKKIKNQLNTFFGGTDTEEAAKRFGMTNPKTGKSNAVVRGAEAYADAATRITLVKTQDLYTKSLSGIWEMDKISRLNFGKGIDKLLRDGEENLFTEEMWGDVITATLKDTYSFDYTKGGGAFNTMAKIVEDVSNAPGLGFVFPFGRFMNNLMGFVTEYSPVGLWPLASKIYKGDIDKFGIEERMAKMVVGTTAAFMLAGSQAEKEKEGLQWNMTENSRGDVIDNANLAPLSFYEITGRILAQFQEGDVPTPELLSEWAKQLGPGQLAGEVSGWSALTDIVTYLTTDGTPEERQGWSSLVLGAAKSMAGQVGSGFTRPFDPINDLVGAQTGTDVLIDKRLASSDMEAIQFELLRYTNNLFAPILGEPLEEGGPNVIGTPARSATEEGDLRDPNPISTLAGRKEVPAMNDINKLLGKVNLPAWKFNQREAVPKYDRYINESVAPRLNERARVMIDDKAFKDASPRMQVKQVRDLLTTVRKEVREEIDDTQLGNNEVRLDKLRAAWTGLDKTYRDEAREKLGVSTPDDKLSEMQITRMRDYMDSMKEFYEMQR